MRVCRQAALLIVFVVAILAGSAGARASAIFTFVQSGGDVVGTLSGSLNLFGATGFATPSYGPTIIPSLAYINASPTPCCSNVGTEYQGVTGPSSFGSNVVDDATATGSGPFEVGSDILIVPAGYTNGAALDNTLTLVGTFHSLGITPGQYVFTLPGATDGTVTVNFVATAMPEPASGLVLAAAFGLLGLARRAGKSTSRAP